MRWTLSIALLCLASSAGCNWSSAARTGPAALPIDGRTPAPERGPTRKLPREISYALETRIADLEGRGGTCSNSFVASAKEASTACVMRSCRSGAGFAAPST